jgi:hypothetical protein
MCVTFDATGAFNSPSLINYGRWSRPVAYEIRIEPELSKSVFRFELAQTV